MRHFRKRTVPELLEVVHDGRMAKKLGVSTLTLTRWRTGTSNPSAENLQKLAEVLGVDFADIDLGRIK